MHAVGRRGQAALSPLPRTEDGSLGSIADVHACAPRRYAAYMRQGRQTTVDIHFWFQRVSRVATADRLTHRSLLGLRGSLDRVRGVVMHPTTQILVPLCVYFFFLMKNHLVHPRSDLIFFKR